VSARTYQARYHRALRAGSHQRDPRGHEPVGSAHAADIGEEAAGAGPRSVTAALVQICLCDVNVAIDLPALPQIPAPATDPATSSANILIGVGCPHAAPWCANLHSARRSRRHRLQFPAGSFIEGFRTPATVQAASLRSAGIRNPQQRRTFVVFLKADIRKTTNRRLRSFTAPA
jgi:hypothetical protein